MKKTDVVSINTYGDGMPEALLLSEETGLSCGLDKKERLRLRLISEELFGMIRSIAGDVKVSYWLEYEGRSFNVQTKADVDLTQEMYNQLVDAATSGTNSASRGFMGKIKSMVALFLLPQSSESYALSLGLMSMGCIGDYASSQYYDWTMTRYRNSLMSGTSAFEGAEEAKDELERSIIANIADEIKVSIVKNNVNITVSKQF